MATTHFRSKTKIEILPQSHFRSKTTPHHAAPRRTEPHYATPPPHAIQYHHQVHPCDPALGSYRQRFQCPTTALTPTCQFWKPSTAMWSDEGCMLVDETSKTSGTTSSTETESNGDVVCSCDHLTDFSLSLSPSLGIAYGNITSLVPTTQPTPVPTPQPSPIRTEAPTQVSRKFIVFCRTPTHPTPPHHTPARHPTNTHPHHPTVSLRTNPPCHHPTSTRPHTLPRP